MPLINFNCQCKHSESKFYRSGKDAPSSLVCPKCNLEMKRGLAAPSSSSIIKVDNGVQAKAVEVNLELIEANKERSTKDFREEK